MFCPQCYAPGVAKGTACDPRTILPFASLIPAHRAPSGHRHEEAYKLEAPCTACGENLWAPLFWPGADQRAWRCVPCSRAKALADYYRRTGSKQEKAARALRVRQRRAEAALKVLRLTVPSLPASVAELAEIERLREENRRANQDIAAVLR